MMNGQCHPLFICIYPAYLNNKKTIAEGRRIPIDKAVENPTSTEIQDVCAAVGFNVLLEKNKMYPREWNRDVQYRGRVRIQLKQDDGNPCLPQFPTRKSVMLYAAETIPKLKTRTQKMGGSDQSLQQGEGGKKASLLKRHSGPRFPVLHNTVQLGLVLQEERTDNAVVEKLCPIGRAWSHAPDQEATLISKEPFL
ncbi:hypothetical protein IHE44_0011098 [Lamprotornis superbus]|uniref:Signal recognition particle 19 kDa protein n=1 Tax=Lamprotornis superbus TaxID=245042 RepID=A0A835TQL9_9PASS|nr:hypothetical protein IHE44_0011098 [Lamprotornis superbus]